MSDKNVEQWILIADDQPDVLLSLRLLLKAEGYGVETVSSPVAALTALDRREFAVVLMDLNYTRDTTSGAEGLDLLERIAVADGPPVVVMTAWGSVELAVEAMRRGARDFVQKPWENARLLATLKTQIDFGRALRQRRRLEEENRLLRGEREPRMIASSAAMQPVLELIECVGPSDANVLITGEHGVGKELVARRLHAISPRARRSMIIVNAGGLAEGVFESELFGHVRGAFTDAKTARIGRFELAEGGTLFLDEIGNMPRKLQNKLLRVLETGEYEPVGSSKTRRADVRVISATNADLYAEVATGAFRHDLLYRLNTVEIHLPPLRERVSDISLLARHFLKRYAQRYQKKLAGFTDEALRALEQHPWPGNVRELEHAIERAVLMADMEMVRVTDLGLYAPVVVPAPAVVADDPGDLDIKGSERALIKKAIAQCGGNISQAAENLGLSRGALYRRLEKYGMRRS